MEVEFKKNPVKIILLCSIFFVGSFIVGSFVNGTLGSIVGGIMLSDISIVQVMAAYLSSFRFY